MLTFVTKTIHWDNSFKENASKDDASRRRGRKGCTGKKREVFFRSLHGRCDAAAWAEADSKKSRLEIQSPGAGASVAGRSPAS